MNERRDFPLDYDEYAETYAWSRFAVPWVVGPLARYAEALPPGATVLEVGCGTGNYIHALAHVRRDLAYAGFDLSEAMLAEARNRGTNVVFRVGNAEQQFPFPEQSVSLAFAVDVIHHIIDLNRFFAEARRVLEPGGRLLIVTDSEETLRRRSLTRFFPEVLRVELSRYPTIAELDSGAAVGGLIQSGHERTEGRIPLEEEFLKRLEAKCSSAIRLITSDEHDAGMKRLRDAAARGEKWLSCYDVLTYLRPTAATV